MATTTFYVRAHNVLAGRPYATYVPMRGVQSHARYGASQQLSFKLPTLGAHQPRVRAA